MIWKEHDFAREVCRQLVELASIRKRVSGDAELLARVQRLEASHQGLLKKLDESYRERRAAKTPERIAPRSEQDPGDAVSGGPEVSRLPESRACAGRMRRHLPETAARKALQGSALGTPRAPRLDEACGRCGRLLLSGVLSGEDIRWREARWYHRACLEAKKGEPSRNGQLN